MYEDLLNMKVRFDKGVFDCSHFITQMTNRDFNYVNGGDSFSRDLELNNSDTYVYDCYIKIGYKEIPNTSVFRKGDVLLQDASNTGRYSHAHYCLDDKLCASINLHGVHLVAIKKILPKCKCLRLDKLGE